MSDDDKTRYYTNVCVKTTFNGRELVTFTEESTEMFRHSIRAKPLFSFLDFWTKDFLRESFIGMIRS